jgi:hypothetical protein
MSGIVGSAFMDALDIFPAVESIRTGRARTGRDSWPTDTLASGRHGVCIAVNGLVTNRHRVAAAY